MLDVTRGLALCSIAALLLAACATPAVVTRPGADLKSVHDAQVLDEVRRLGRDGDWLVIRGYHATDNMVSVATNTPWSHAAVLDKDHDQVVEAEGKGVHTTPLAEFVAKSHRLMLVRSNWATGKSSAEAVRNARKWVGRPYDFLGLAGLDIPDQYYCSELAVAVYRGAIPSGTYVPRPVTPAQLHYWGRILYDSGEPLDGR
jgi:permuted papain-like amidase YaeF/Yiix C92 family enzyme